MLINPVHDRPITVHCLDATSRFAKPIVDEKENATKSDKDKDLVCHICHHVITEDTERINIQGKNSHYRTNPAGFSYGFDCFQAAPGCTVVGTPSTEHTWFDGYRWQISVCQQCGEQLGWRFEGESQFFGLIHGRIISMEE